MDEHPAIRFDRRPGTPPPGSHPTGGRDITLIATQEAVEHQIAAPDGGPTPADRVGSPLRRRHLLELDPDLGAALAPAAFDEAERTLVVTTRAMGRGTLRVGEPGDGTGVLGLLVVEGHVSATDEIANRRNAEVLGPGDVTRPWVQGDTGIGLECHTRWRVLVPTSVAVIDRQVVAAAARWPEITAALMERLVLRTRHMSVRTTVTCLPRTTERVLFVLWQLAGRWGTVTRDGVAVRIPLTHGELAALARAHRPSVTTALGALRDHGLVTRTSDGAFVLRAPAPASPAELQAMLADVD